MAVSIEGYVLTNFLMNALALVIVARSLGHFSMRRVLAAAGVGAAYAVAAQLTPLHFLKGLPAGPLVAVLLAAIAFPAASLRSLSGRSAQLLGAVIFLGGAQFLFRQAGLRPVVATAVGGALGGCALASFLTARQKRLVSWEVSVYLCFGGGEARFRALVDTGNRLREPLSSLPVLIVQKSFLLDVLPEGYDETGGDASPPPGFRQVAFGALGGAGKLNCFRPDLTLISYGDGYLKAPDLWVAVYPGHMPGCFGALAPPIVGCIEKPVGKPRIQNARIYRQTRGESIWHLPR